MDSKAFLGVVIYSSKVTVCGTLDTFAIDFSVEEGKNHCTSTKCPFRDVLHKTKLERH